MGIIVFTLCVFWFFNLVIFATLSQSHPVGRFWFYNWNRNYTLIISHILSMFFIMAIPIFLYFFTI